MLSINVLQYPKIWRKTVTQNNFSISADLNRAVNCLSIPDKTPDKLSFLATYFSTMMKTPLLCKHVF